MGMVDGLAGIFYAVHPDVEPRDAVAINDILSFVNNDTPDQAK